MTMFTSKPKFNLAEFLATPAPSGARRNRSRSGAKMWQARAPESAGEAPEAGVEAQDANNIAAKIVDKK